MIAGSGEIGSDRLHSRPWDVEVDRVRRRRVAALESRIACRSEPAPLSDVVSTRNVDSRVRSSIEFEPGPESETHAREQQGHTRRRARGD